MLILRAKLPPEDRTAMDFSSSPIWPALVHMFRHGREVHFPDRSHFSPMEIPEQIAELILAEARAGQDWPASRWRNPGARLPAGIRHSDLCWGHLLPGPRRDPIGDSQ